jgi:hypothetical protein
MTRVLTLGHGTAPEAALLALLEGAGVACRWEPELGGRRRPVPGTVNHALGDGDLLAYDLGSAPPLPEA